MYRPYLENGSNQLIVTDIRYQISADPKKIRGTHCICSAFSIDIRNVSGWLHKLNSVPVKVEFDQLIQRPGLPLTTWIQPDPFFNVSYKIPKFNIHYRHAEYVYTVLRQEILKRPVASDCLLLTESNQFNKGQVS